MIKLIKYELINSYRYPALGVFFAGVVYILQYFLYKNSYGADSVNTVGTIAVYCGIIAYSVASLNDGIDKKEDILLYITPVSKGEVYTSKLIVTIIYTLILVLVFSGLNLSVKYVPFIGSQYSLGMARFMSDKQVLILRMFYIGWSSSYIAALVVGGMFIATIINTFLKASRYKFISSLMLYLTSIYLFHIFMIKYMQMMPWIYRIKINTASLYGRLGGVTLFGSGDYSVFNLRASQVVLGFSAPVFNLIWCAILFLATRFLFDRRVEV